MTNLPCPICGREMTAFETRPGRGELYCEKCDLLIGGDNPKTPDELKTIVEESRYSTSSKQVKRLKGEITKLRTIYRLQEHLTDMHAKRECELMEENANLRKYVRELLRVVRIGEIDCGACNHFDECYAGDAMDFAPENCRLVVYARELGIKES